jgi:hypothetical protein
MRYESEEKMRARVNGRIGFRTRSEVEILDDGFKWRKYGKKAVKNSPNPRYTNIDVTATMPIWLSILIN